MLEEKIEERTLHKKNAWFSKFYSPANQKYVNDSLYPSSKGGVNSHEPKKRHEGQEPNNHEGKEVKNVPKNVAKGRSQKTS